MSNKGGNFIDIIVKLFNSIKDSITYGFELFLKSKNPLNKRLRNLVNHKIWGELRYNFKSFLKKLGATNSVKKVKDVRFKQEFKRTIDASKSKLKSFSYQKSETGRTESFRKKIYRATKGTFVKFYSIGSSFRKFSGGLVSKSEDLFINRPGKNKKKKRESIFSIKTIFPSKKKIIYLPEKVSNYNQLDKELKQSTLPIKKLSNIREPWIFKKAVRVCFKWGIYLGGFGFVSGILLIVSIYFGYFGKIPSYSDLENINNHTVSQVYSSDGKILGKYFWQNRTNVVYDSIPKDFVKALVATEDVRFYEHSGIDYQSLLRVFVKSILLQNESSGGGSTITQQLVKNLFPRKKQPFLSTPINKVKEMFAARRLEKIYTKEEILTYYINTVYFGDNTYGLVAASERFFSKKPTKLSIEDGAILVGLLKAPGYYNPKKNYKRALLRRNTVLEQMHKYNFLSEDKMEACKKTPITLKYKFLTHNDGLAPYFREQIRMEIQEFLDKNPTKDGKTYNLYADGLKVYTSLDSKMQLYAEMAVEEHLKELQKAFDNHWKYVDLYKDKKDLILTAQKQSRRYKSLKDAGATNSEIKKSFNTKENMEVFTWNGEQDKEMTPLDSIKYYQKFLQAGFLAVDPKTGYVKAWVGGIDHKYFQYDHVRSKRQVGSIFKPIVYAAALKNGMKPCRFVPNERKVYEEYEGWSPRNADGKYGGFYSVKGGLTNSVNTISVSIAMETGINNVVGLAKNLGITSNLPAVPSIALGTAEISLFEMVGAYTAFANKGVKSKPTYILKIENRNGEVIYEHKPVFRKEDKVLSPTETEIMVEMLQSVVDSGTAARIRYKYNFKSDIAGKTGTTQSNSDGWFIGFTPDILAGVWVGGEDRRVHFRTTALGQGANMALPIWAKFIGKVYADPEYVAYKNNRFDQPSEFSNSLLSCELYKENMNIFHGIFDLFKPRKIKDPIIVFPKKNTRPKKKNTKPYKKRRKRKNWKYLLKS